MTSQRDSLATHVSWHHEEAVQRVTARLAEQGFGVLTTIDVRAVMKEKMGVDFRAYSILGACNPNISYKAFQRSLEAGLVLPCNVVVHEDETGNLVRIADPGPIMGVLGDPELDRLAVEARVLLESVIRELVRDDSNEDSEGSSS